MEPSSAEEHSAPPTVTSFAEPDLLARAPGLTPIPTAAVKPTAPPTPKPTPTPYSFIDGFGNPVYGYEYGVSVPESETVDAEYFSDTVFIGDSLTVGLRLYGDLKSADFLAAKSVTAINIFGRKVISGAGNSYITIPEALGHKTYGKVYVMLGVNELSSKPEDFRADYGKVIDAIKDAQPNAAIYVQAMLPVTEGARNSSGANFSNEHIRERNDTLVSLCKERGCFYIDMFGAFADENGALAEAGASDGVHLKPSQYAAWGEFLKSHTLEEVKWAEEHRQLSAR
jgi:lysophospholipase L1-like esterase